MLDSINRPFLLLAFGLMLLVLLVELGMGSVAPPAAPVDAAQLCAQAGAPSGQVDAASLSRAAAGGRPPGLAVRYLALLDGVVAFTLGLMVLGLLLGQNAEGRIQGILTLVVSLLAVLGGLVLLFTALALLLTMVVLFLAVPFGTLAYLAIFGSFDRSGAAVTLSLVMLLKLGAAVCLGLAHRGFLTNKRLVLLVLTSLVGNVVISFLHGLVPSFLVSITDAIAALVVDGLGCLWFLVMLVFSLLAIVKILRRTKSADGSSRPAPAHYPESAR